MMTGRPLPSPSVGEPWLGDACSLVDAFRSGERTPSEELDAVLAAIDGDGDNDDDNLNAFSFVDRDRAAALAAESDVSAPFGGVPFGVKELEAVAGWPDTHASVPLRDQVARYTSTHVQRLAAAGAIPVGLTTSSEFGTVNLTRTVLNGVTRNPWNRDRTPGGSSGGSAAAVAGGIVTLATASDGGGSIRIPAGFCGLVGLKSTYGRIPRGPAVRHANLTTTVGCVSRSVRDTARWFDVANGHDAGDPLSLPATGGWEAGLGTRSDDVVGRRVAVVENWGGATVAPAVWAAVDEVARELISDSGLVEVDGIDTSLPRLGRAWALGGMVEVASMLGDRWPGCADELTPEVRDAMESTSGTYSMETRWQIEQCRVDLNEAMARIFDPVDGVDLVITASNPDVAFAADGPLPDTFGGLVAGAGNNGRLTFPANFHGCPAISVPAGTVDELPVGLQIVGRHFSEPLLLELALLIERSRPWPVTATVPTAHASTERISR
jgi:aspartyl-tRNA(Asn)/glutamyl-tRNA(Gln) amidotransferase subunit A